MHYSSTYLRNSLGSLTGNGCLPNKRLNLQSNWRISKRIKLLKHFLTLARQRTTCLLYGYVHSLLYETESLVQYNAMYHRQFCKKICLVVAMYIVNFFGTFFDLQRSIKAQRDQNHPIYNPYFYLITHYLI